MKDLRHSCDRVFARRFPLGRSPSRLHASVWIERLHRGNARGGRRVRQDDADLQRRQLDGRGEPRPGRALRGAARGGGACERAGAADSASDGAPRTETVSQAIRAGGFRDVVIIADEGAGPADRTLRDLAERLEAEWQPSGVRILHVTAHEGRPGQDMTLERRLSAALGQPNGSARTPQGRRRSGGVVVRGSGARVVPAAT